MSIKDLAENLGMKTEEFREIFEIYLKTTDSDLEGLKKALNNGDAPQAHLRAHSIKGASGNLGLNDLYELAKRIDDIVRIGRLNGVDEEIRAFEQRYSKLVMDI